MRSFLDGLVTTDHFCSRFETAFNFEIDKAVLVEEELTALTRLFNDVVYYSPFPEERTSYPGYRDEAAIRVAVEAAYQVASRTAGQTAPRPNP